MGKEGAKKNLMHTHLFFLPFSQVLHPVPWVIPIGMQILLFLPLKSQPLFFNVPLATTLFSAALPNDPSELPTTTLHFPTSRSLLNSLNLTKNGI